MLLGLGVKENSPNKVVVALLDLSESTNKPEIREKYVAAFKSILEKITHGDAFVVALITEKSVAELNIPIKENIPRFVPISKNEFYRKGEEDLANKELNKRKEKLVKDAETILLDQTRKIMKTDIMSSLQVAERIFSSFSQPQKILVILSDMLEDSVDYNFEKENLSAQRREAILARERNKSRIPQLGGVKVYVVGATAPNLDYFYNIQSFWLEYFKASGALLLKKDYGSVLLVFNE